MRLRQPAPPASWYTYAQAMGEAIRAKPSAARLGRADWFAAAAVCVGAWAVLLVTAADVGLTYDEPIYMGRAQLARQWLAALVFDPAAALSREGIERFWPPKDMHPGLVKLTGALAEPMASVVLPAWARPLAAPRAGTVFWVGLACAVLYLWLRSAGLSQAASAFAPLALLSCPRAFGHSHLLAMDGPAMATFAIGLAAAWWACRGPSLWRMLAAGAAFGLAISAKLNGFFLPIATLAWAALSSRRCAWRLALSYCTVGAAVFLLTWPWLWYDTLDHLRQYLAFHWKHWEICVLYFGRVYRLAPWHYAPVMMAVTTPVFVLLLGVSGFGGGAEELAKRRAGAAGLAALGLVSQLGPMMLPSTPKYGGVRLFLPAAACLAVLAACSFDRILSALARHAPRWGSSGAVRALLAALLVVPGYSAVARLHPYELSYYNELIGGLPGAARRGMEPTYWGETYLAAAAWLSRHAPPGAVVWVDPPGMESIMRMYRVMGILRPDIATTAGEAGFEGADFAVSQNKPTEFSAITKRLVARQRPVWVEERQGVPLIFVWRLGEPAGEAEAGPDK